jgi:hypothetical protein
MRSRMKVVEAAKHRAAARLVVLIEERAEICGRFPELCQAKLSLTWPCQQIRDSSQPAPTTSRPHTPLFRLPAVN